jgi:hypothetical protein
MSNCSVLFSQKKIVAFYILIFIRFVASYKQFLLTKFDEETISTTESSCSIITEQALKASCASPQLNLCGSQH